MPPERWPEIIERAPDESLRALVRAYGVSHNAIRTVLVKTGHVYLLSDQGRRQRLAAQAPLPPLAAAKIPRERHGDVLTLCQRHMQAEVAAMLGVSQATVWRIVQREKQRAGLGAGRSRLACIPPSQPSHPVPPVPSAGSSTSAGRWVARRLICDQCAAIAVVALGQPVIGDGRSGD